MAALKAAILIDQVTNANRGNNRDTIAVRNVLKQMGFDVDILMSVQPIRFRQNWSIQGMMYMSFRICTQAMSYRLTISVDSSVALSQSL